MSPTAFDDDVVIARADADDLPAVLGLLRRALGWADTDTSFLEWKHLRNPFGVSPMWVARAGPRVIGFRAVLRWELVTPQGNVLRAARAVDTATDPDFRARGIFTTLTLSALESLRADDVDLLFNTPNPQSLRGYVRMGWRSLGRLPVAIRPARARVVGVLTSARRAAGREPVPTMLGVAASNAFEDVAALDRLLARVPPAPGLATNRSGDYLRWRYGRPQLGYRALVHGAALHDGVLVFRLRRRGAAVEAVVAETLVPGGAPAVSRALLRELARSCVADYLLRLDRRRVTRDGFVRLPHVGPVLVAQSLRGVSVPDQRGWAFGMGDVELL